MSASDGHLDGDPEDGQANSVAIEILESRRAAGDERDVQSAVIGHQVPHVRLGEGPGVVVEADAIGIALRPHPGVHRPEGVGELGQVFVGALGHDVDVRCHVRRSVDHRGEAADDHEADTVVGQHPEHALGGELRLRHAVGGAASRPARAKRSAAWCCRTRSTTVSWRLALATDQSESSAGRSVGTSSRSQARAIRARRSRLGSVRFASSRATADCVVPTRAASSAWVRPARRRASRASDPDAIRSI